jgi:hypothetical protein
MRLLVLVLFVGCISVSNGFCEDFASYGFYQSPCQKVIEVEQDGLKEERKQLLFYLTGFISGVNYAEQRMTDATVDYLYFRTVKYCQENPSGTFGDGLVALSQELDWRAGR